MATNIMIVDDSPTILMSLEMTFSMNDIGVTKAASAEEAVAKLKGGLKPSMIITDLNMGAMNGIELIRAIRKMAGLQFLPIVLLTTESQQDKRQEAKAAGATGWLVKPAQGDMLMNVVRQVLKL